MKWICADDCAWIPKRGKREPCPLCCGYTIEETAVRKRWFHGRELVEQQTDRLAWKRSLELAGVAGGEAAAPAGLPVAA